MSDLQRLQELEDIAMLIGGPMPEELVYRWAKKIQEAGYKKLSGVPELEAENARLKEDWVDPETGEVWIVPTAWSYAAACKALRKHHEDKDRLQRQLAEEVAKVDAIHKALGSPTHEQMAGRTLAEMVKDLAHESSVLNKKWNDLIARSRRPVEVNP
jgi:predicted metallo-beta-lactamase superfamily hydrolase